MTKKLTQKLSSLFSALVLLFGLLAAITDGLSTAHAASFKSTRWLKLKTASTSTRRLLPKWTRISRQRRKALS